MIVIFCTGVLLLFVMPLLVVLVPTMIHIAMLSMFICTILLRIRTGLLGLPNRPRCEGVIEEIPHLYTRHIRGRIFYDCDYLYWSTFSNGIYACIGSDYNDDSQCGLVTLNLNYIASDTIPTVGALFILFYDCDYLSWSGNANSYAYVGAHYSQVLKCGAFCTHLNNADDYTGQHVGASFILFYDCDYLFWDASAVYYAFVGGDCRDGSLCGAFYTVLNGAATYTYWNIGAYY